MEGDSPKCVEADVVQDNAISFKRSRAVNACTLMVSNLYMS